EHRHRGSGLSARGRRGRDGGGPRRPRRRVRMARGPARTAPRGLRVPSRFLAVVARDYAGVDDLRRMQSLVQDCWALRGPAGARHVGDRGWGRFQHVGREPLWRTRLWEEDGRTLAYGWLFEGNVLDFCVHPERLDLLEDVLAWANAAETDALDSNIGAIA